MKIEDTTNTIFLAFKKVLNYSDKETLVFLKREVETLLSPEKIVKKILVKLFTTLKEYCENIYNIDISKEVFVYDVKSIILMYNIFMLY